MSSLVRPITRRDIKGPALYGPIRDDYRKRVIELKRAAPRPDRRSRRRWCSRTATRSRCRSRRCAAPRTSTRDDQIEAEIAGLQRADADRALAVGDAVHRAAAGRRRPRGAQASWSGSTSTSCCTSDRTRSARRSSPGRSTDDRISAVQYTRYPLTRRGARGAADAGHADRRRDRSPELPPPRRVHRGAARVARRGLCVGGSPSLRLLACVAGACGAGMREQARREAQDVPVPRPHRRATSRRATSAGDEIGVQMDCADAGPRIKRWKTDKTGNRIEDARVADARRVRSRVARDRRHRLGEPQGLHQRHARQAGPGLRVRRQGRPEPGDVPVPDATMPYPVQRRSSIRSTSRRSAAAGSSATTSRRT